MLGTSQGGPSRCRIERQGPALRVRSGSSGNCTSRTLPIRNQGFVLLSIAFGAFVAVPTLHLVDHRDDHTHVGGQPVYHHHHPSPSDGSHESPPEEDSRRHENGSLCHFGLLTVAAEWTDPVEAPTGIDEGPAYPPRTPFVRALHTPHQARAPPV